MIFELAAIYSNTIYQGESIKLVHNQTEIEFFCEPRSYRVPKVNNYVFPAGQNSIISEDTVVNLPKDNKYLIITARSKESDFIKARTICRNKLDKTITYISLNFGIGLCANLIYRGWIFNTEAVVAETWVMLLEPKEFTKSELFNSLKDSSKSIQNNVEFKNRFELMAHFFSKAVSTPPSEEKFLYLWTILEIFPMKNTTNIRPISEYLSPILKKPVNEVKERLDIGRMYGIRCDLVHNGFFGVQLSEAGKFFTKLQEICHVILRNICGLTYEYTLDKYF